MKSMALVRLLERRMSTMQNGMKWRWSFQRKTNRKGLYITFWPPWACRPILNYSEIVRSSDTFIEIYSTIIGKRSIHVGVSNPMPHRFALLLQNNLQRSLLMRAVGKCDKESTIS